MPDRRDISDVSVKIDGTLASPEVVAHLEEIVVDQSLHLPSMFSIRLHSPDMKWLEDSTFREGKKIEIFFGERPAVQLLSGKISGLEPDLKEESPSLTVRGYALSLQLYRGRYRRSFNQVSDSDLASKLASEAGLRPGTIDSSSTVHNYAFQNNQTNAEFLRERARLLGYELWVEDEELHFRRPAPNGQPVTLAWGDNLRSFSARLSTAEQVNEVEVRGWDPKQKREVVGSATQGAGSPEIGLSQNGSDVAKSAWGEAKVAVVRRIVSSQGEAETIAQSVLDEMASSFVEAEGTCDANADVRPGRQVEVKGIGQRFAGKYYVTQAVHTWNKGQGMVTHFTISGRRDTSLWSLLQDRAAPESGVGLVIGIVTNNKDPEEMGRVKVKYPWLSADNESDWARVAAPMAGSGRGFLFLPEVDDEVLVGFEHGDIHHPFVIGSLWNGQDKPPVNASQAVGADGKVNQRVLKSRSGHTITLDDTTGGEKITIVDKTGANKIVITSPDNSMEIKVQGNLKIEAQGKVEITGTAGVEVSSQAQLKLSGQAGAELSSTAQTAVKGTQVDVNGSAMVQMQGGLVKIN